MALPSPTSLPLNLSLSHLHALASELYTTAAAGWAAARTPPFGPFNRLHERIIAQAVGFSPANAVIYLAPVAFIYAQTYLLLAPGTRYARAALGVAALSGMWAAWTHIRFTDPWHNGWNHVVTMPYLQFMVKALEFSLLKGPIRDPYMPPRWRAVAAWDLLINSRCVGLGNVGLDEASGIPNAKARPGQVERQLRKNVGGWRPTSRPLAILRHAAYAALCYSILDTFFQVFPRVHPVWAQPYGGKDVLEVFMSSHIALFPSTLNVRAPPAVLLVAVEAIVGLSIWMFFEGIYQFFAVIHLLLGWPVAAWDPNMFGSMWRADSLIDLWGTRWHQVFRHMFIVGSHIVLRALGLPPSGISIFFLSFFFSGAIHFASEMAMDPVGSPGTLILFFLVCGAGCALEVLFKRATGRRVRGVLGQIWTWAFMAAAGTVIAPAWLASGYAGCHILPPGGPGTYAAQFVLEHVLAPGKE